MSLKDLINQPGYKRRPYIKFVQRKAPIKEAIFFEGGMENAHQIVEWVRLHGGLATHLLNGGIIPEYIRIEVPDRVHEGEVNVLAVQPGYWVIRQPDGGYEKMHPRNFEDDYNTFDSDEFLPPYAEVDIKATQRYFEKVYGYNQGTTSNDATT